MSKVVVIESLTLDGVMQAPGRPDEDRAAIRARRLGVPYATRCWAGSWPSGWPIGALCSGGAPTRTSTALAEADRQPVHRGARQGHEVRGLDDAHRAAAHGKTPRCSTGDAPAVAGLREEPGGDLVVLGSGELAEP